MAPKPVPNGASVVVVLEAELDDAVAVDDVEVVEPADDVVVVVAPDEDVVVVVAPGVVVDVVVVDVVDVVDVVVVVVPVPAANVMGSSAFGWLKSW